MKSIAMGMVAAALALSVGCSGGGGGGGGGGGTATTSHVTLSGTVGGMTPASAPLQMLRAGAGMQPAYTTLNQLALYCVTFTDPPHSGTGAFDLAGHFSVTVPDAAGVPVGCFIVDTSLNNAVVTTLNFTVGTGGLTGGSSSSAAFDGGSHTISITFDPATNTATADVSTVASAPAAQTTLNLADLAGQWTMTCSASNTVEQMAACNDQITNESPTVFIDVITATMSGNSVYAMGAWPDEATFNAGGKTEGFYAPGLPAEITAGPTSLVAGADPTAAFAGFTSAAGYDRAANTMAAADAWAFLIGGTVLADLGWDSIGGDVGNVTCSTALPTSTTPWPASPTADQKICLLAYLDRAADEDRGLTTPYFIPRVDWELSSTQFVNGTGADVVFRGTAIGETPDIKSRFALMGLEVAGNTAIASVRHSESYSYEEEDASPHSCSKSEGTNIVFVINSATSASGWFTKTEFEDCDNTPSNNAVSFQVDFAK